MTGAELFEIKMKTGKYDHYDKHALEMLFCDCKIQAKVMELTNSETK